MTRTARLTTANITVGATIELDVPGRMLGGYAIGTITAIETDPWTPTMVTFTMRESDTVSFTRTIGGRGRLNAVAWLCDPR